LEGVGDSCITWCGMHGLMYFWNQFDMLVPCAYLILPDNSPEPITAPPQDGCLPFCGGTTNSSFFNLMSTAVHELFEAITCSWEFQDGQEIGDPCQNRDEQWVGTDGHTYNSQRFWSNKYGQCIGNTKSNFELLPIGYKYLWFSRGDAVTYTIQTNNFYPQTSVLLSITVQGLPPGWTFTAVSTQSGQAITAGVPFNLTIQSTTDQLVYHPILSVGGYQLVNGVADLTNNCQVKIEAIVANFVNGVFGTKGLAGWSSDYAGQSATTEPTFGSAVLLASPDTTKTCSISQDLVVNFIQLNITYRIVCIANYLNEPSPLPVLTDTKKIGIAGAILRNQYIVQNMVYGGCEFQPNPEATLNVTKPYFYFTQVLDTSQYVGQTLTLSLFSKRELTNVNHSVVAQFYQIVPIFYPTFSPYVPLT